MTPPDTSSAQDAPTTSLADEEFEQALRAAPEPHRLIVWETDATLFGGLMQAMGPRSELWEATYVRDVDQLRAAMANVHFDVVLADIEAVGPMASVLAEVSLRAPWALRVLMGRPGADLAMTDAVAAAHRFVPRPLDLPVLLDDLAATLRRRSVLGDVEALRLAFAHTALPAAPGLWMRVSEMLADPEVGGADIGAAVQEDVGVSAKVLSLANSAWFGLPRQVADVTEAVVLVGGEGVQALVLAAELESLLGHGMDAAWLRTFEEHAVRVARAAAIVAPPALRPRALTAGLLHDVGSMVMTRYYPEIMQAGRTMMRSVRLEMERDLVGATHAEIGGLLLHAWGLPDAIVDAVIDHHTPSVGLRGQLTLAGCIHVANALVHDHEDVLERGLPYLDDLGMADRVPEWVGRITVDAR